MALVVMARKEELSLMLGDGPQYGNGIWNEWKLGVQFNTKANHAMFGAVLKNLISERTTYEIDEEGKRTEAHQQSYRIARLINWLLKRFLNMKRIALRLNHCMKLAMPESLNEDEQEAHALSYDEIKTKMEEKVQ